jgi:filamentous hemagglutinin
MAQLPGAADATLDDLKITGYLLDPRHPIGAAKKRFFTAFGFSLASWQVFKAALLAHPIRNLVVAQYHNAWGTKYEIHCSLATPDQRNPCIVSVWIVEQGYNPRFVTAYPGPGP